MKLIQSEEKELIIKCVLEKYVDMNRIIKNKLIWNSFFIKPDRMTFEQLSNFELPNLNNLLFYNERKSTLYRCKFSDVIHFINELEPWEDVDCYIFDDSTDWIVAITHEDLIVLAIGLDLLSRK